MAIEELLRRVRARVPDCTAAFVVSTADGSLVSEQTADDVKRERLGVIAAAIYDLFSTENAVGGGEAHEVIILSDEMVCVGHRMSGGNSLLSAVCRTTTNLGLLLGSLRRELAGAGEATS